MELSRRLIALAGSSRCWIALGIIAPIGMLVLSGILLLDLRRDAWERSEQTSRNLLQVIERDIARNVELIDLSLQGVVENLRDPETRGVSPRARQMILFDRSATAKDLGVLLVIDENGDIAIDAAQWPPRKGNYAHREYFAVHRDRPDAGLHIGKPLVSQLTGERILPFSRRINKPDGSFGGVALATLRLSYFSGLFDRIGLGRDGGINLYLRDGTRVARHPSVEADIGANIAGTANFERFLREGNGTFVGVSVRDGIERNYDFTKLGDLPMILNVAMATADVDSDWRSKALGIAGMVTVLCGLTVAMSLLFGRELRLRERMNEEMARLSLTDALTGLGNRRRFERELARAVEDAAGLGQPLTLLVVDADHFKRINDSHGHAVGDEVLKGLASCLARSVHRPRDLACRIGGEEFAMILPNTDAAGADRVADEIHGQVSRLSVASAGIEAGSVTVSIGAATGIAGTAELYATADAALYQAKAGGRNQTRHAAPTARAPQDGRKLRLVGA